MLTENDFRRIALGMKGAIESAHMGHPDFSGQRTDLRDAPPRSAVGDGQADARSAAEEFMRASPDAFKPEAGAWGRQGCTAVRLDAVDEETVGEALTLAWRNARRSLPHPERKPNRPGRATRARRKV